MSHESGRGTADASRGSGPQDLFGDGILRRSPSPGLKADDADPPAPPLLCGLDEAGRGPLAGPVAAAAVVLGADFPSGILDDSKKLSERRREEAARTIFLRAAAWGIGWASAEEIDRINILNASLLAMERAYAQLSLVPTEAVVDGLYVPSLPIPARALVKADATVPAVMAASILAKVARDRVMVRWSWIYPEYGYELHKGYPTALHVARIATHGPSPLQRRSFRVRALEQGLLDFSGKCGTDSEAPGTAPPMGKSASREQAGGDV